MPAAKNDINEFTFLNYSSPHHGASHRKAVKSHISSKYRATVRHQTQPRYALPHRARLPEREEEGSKRQRREKTTSPALIRSPIRLHHRISSPLEVSFPGTRVDPFRSFPGQATPCVSKALDYYTQAISPLMEPLLLAVNMANPLLIWMFPLIMSHESAYHGAVALSQAYLEKRQAPFSIPSTEVIYHRRRAVSTLRKQLSELRGVPDDGALMTVLALASLDVLYREDRISNRKGLALIVALKGGLDNLGLNGLVKAFLVQFDYFWMLETGAETLFPFNKRKGHRVYPQRPFEYDVLSLIASLPPGFAAVARQGVLGIDVLRILSRVSAFLKSKTDNCHSPPGWESLVHDNQEYPDLFDVCASLQSSPYTEHSLEKNLILAVIMFSFDMHNPSGSMSKVAAYRGSRQELTRSIPFILPRSPEQRSCLIWIWMIVLRSWSLELSLPSQVASLSEAFFGDSSEAHSWALVEQAMSRFFWYPPLAEGFRRSWLSAFDAAHLNTPLPCASMANTYSLETSQFRTSGYADTPKAASNESVQDTVGRHTSVPLPQMLTLEKYLENVQ